MRLFTRYYHLSADERRMFFRALALVAAIRVALWILPFRVTRRWVERLGRPTGPWCELDRMAIRRAAWAVGAASRRVPRATCLTQGMAMQILLGRQGQRTHLHLGVARKEDGKLEAHAWVEAQGRIIAGAAVDGFGRFARLDRQPL